MDTSGVRRLVAAGLTTGVSDFLFACVLNVGFFGSTVTRLWQGVAYTLLGNEAFEGGTGTALVGVAMHFGVAFFWSGVFFLLARARWMRRALSSRSGALAVAAASGVAIWLVMSLLVIPALVHRPPTLNARWWIQLAGHVPFVGLPIVWWQRPR